MFLAFADAVSRPTLPGWAVIPGVALVMLVIAAHVLAIQRVEMPPSRRRIRTANGLVMLLVAPVLGFALSAEAMSHQKTFLLVWITIMMLVGVVLLLAGLDVLNNIRLYSRARQDLARRTADALAQSASAARAARSHGGKAT